MLARFCFGGMVVVALTVTQAWGDDPRNPDDDDAKTRTYRLENDDDDATSRTYRATDPYDRWAYPRYYDRTYAGTTYARSGSYITIGFDFDNDGAFDAFEQIQRSDLRQVQAFTRPLTTDRYATAGDVERTWANEQRVAGTIQTVYELKDPATRHKSMAADIRTSDGNIVRVNFGAKDDFKRLKLKEGDWVAVTGTRGTISDPNMFLVRRIDSERGQMTVAREFGGLQRYQGEILNVYEIDIEDVGETLVARVRLDNGTTKLVNLGKKGELKNIRPAAGAYFVFMATPGTIDGTRALLAHEVNAQGRTVEIDWPQNRTTLFTDGGSFRVVEDIEVEHDRDYDYEPD